MRAALERGHHPAGQGQQRIGLEQVKLQVTLRDSHRMVCGGIGVRIAHDIGAPVGCAAGCRRVPVDCAFPAAGPARVGRVGVEAIATRVFRADELLFHHQGQAVVLANDDIAAAVGGGGGGQFGHPGVDRLGHRADGVLGLDQHIGAFAADIAPVVVDQTAVGRLQADPARALVVGRGPGGGALPGHGDEVGLEHDIRVVAIGAQIDMAVAGRHQVLDHIERGQRLQHDAAGFHVAFHDHGTSDPPEGSGSQIADFLASDFQSGGVADVAAQ